ncbi:hypothetical protein [Sinomicrobium sp. M5D2P17]
MQHVNYKKLFLRLLIAALCISAAIGIFVFLAGDYGDTEIKILLTTLSLVGYSLSALCCSTIYERDSLKNFSFIGMVISGIGFLVTITAIWEFMDTEDIYKTVITFMILATAFGHISLLLLIKPKNDTIKYLLMATVIFVCIVAVMLIYATAIDFDVEEFYFRLLGVFTILDVLGTIATPIANKIIDKQDL